ncbi:type II toxin-antitoxin system RelE/ParE family toxin [Ideonella sp. BN130291]|uniref:type II toxin-antitoxin system RelE/ParE family toxin n=1 Tax=Ideonella sp. BN130291 TaxID=3112940 RepID=UPI002E270410|nr:type II toxin-antitoxin system RelE/ParE family toxin [Ideonella sp. BN130291]
MARVELAPEVADDFERIFEHLAQHDPEAASRRLPEIIEALSILGSNPLIGRPAQNELRELVIGRRSKGYVALYRYLPDIDVVFVLAIRGQREAGYAGD